MDIIQQIISYIVHVDSYLADFLNIYGIWTYVLLFLIIFSETGLVITPFLPGDSLLFAAGALTALSLGTMNIHFLFCLLVFASISGNMVNYFIGRFIGPKIFHSSQSWFFNKAYLVQAHDFYQQHGGKTIILARFIPIIRTFSPFVAGIANMPLFRFSMFNIAGAILWVGLLLYTSYYFGTLPIVKEHFSVIAFTIVIVSVLPALWAYFYRKSARSA